MIQLEIGPLITILGALIGTGGIGALLKIAIDRKSGAEAKRVAEVERIKALLDKERRRADIAEAGKRIYAEALSLHRRLMYELDCFDPDTMPLWPETPKE